MSQNEDGFNFYVMIKNDNEFNPLREQKRMKMNFHLNKPSLFKNITFSLPLMYFHRWITSVTCFFTSVLNHKNRQYAYFSKQNLSITSLSKKNLSITSPSYIDFGGKQKDPFQYTQNIQPKNK